MSRLNVAIVGCGWTAESQVETGFAVLPDQFALRVACDVDAGRAKSFAAKHSIPASESDYSALLRRSDVDVVSICTPPSLHYSMVMSALAAGKHVICEKPFVASLAQLDRIRKAEAETTARVMPIFQYRFGDGIARAKRVIELGLAGRGYISSIETAWQRDASYYEIAWRGKFATELGGVLLTQAIHMHDLLLYIVGPAARVAAFKATRVNPVEVEDCAVASLVMADGSLASLTATLGSALQLTRMRFCFENVTFEVQSTKDMAGRPGDAEWDVIPKTPEIGARIRAAMEEVPRYGLPRFARQFELFHSALATGAPFPVTLDDARRSLELVTAIFHANETACVVQLPIGPEHPKYEGWIPKAATAIA